MNNRLVNHYNSKLAADAVGAVSDVVATVGTFRCAVMIGVCFVFGRAAFFLVTLSIAHGKREIADRARSRNRKDQQEYKRRDMSAEVCHVSSQQSYSSYSFYME